MPLCTFKSSILISKSSTQINTPTLLANILLLSINCVCMINFRSPQRYPVNIFYKTIKIITSNVYLQVQDEMKSTVKEQTRLSWEAYPVDERVHWVTQWPGQVIITYFTFWKILSLFIWFWAMRCA